MEIVLPNLRSLNTEKKAKQKMAPGCNPAEYKTQFFLTDYIWNDLHEKTKNIQFWSAFALNLPKCIFTKHASTLDVAVVTKDGRRRLKIVFLFSKLVFIFSESFKSIAQGVLEIFE